MLTIVVPYKNDLHKLRRLLESVSADVGTSVIVVDDNSDGDKRADQLKGEFNEVQFVANPGPEYNGGAARNVGMQFVKTEWVVFADADDYFLGNAIETAKGLLGELPCDVDIVFFSVTSHSDDFNRPGSRHLGYMRKIDECIDTRNSFHFRYCSPVPWAKLIRVSLLTRHSIAFDSELAGNDVVFSLLSGHYARRVAITKHHLYCVTESSTSLTQNLDEHRALARLRSLTRANNLVLDWKITKQMNFGIAWFFASRPHCLNTVKATAYLAWFGMLFRRLVTYRSRIIRDLPLIIHTNSK